ncbi:hypothetical protein BQ8794_50199 [Mesorhizobium prunaredense]|uniref:Uncharacterized protein n=1 Tax=Mesorhizobium prunaredense TaxID=1631249 RepID=A0A1R3VDY5_9HYPH|nr:hypothetical protein BQ8794_50199 [Mesorhizobium prunaredense]
MHVAQKRAAVLGRRHASNKKLRVAQEHALGREPRVRSGFGTIWTWLELKVRRRGRPNATHFKLLNCRRVSCSAAM